MLNPLRGGGDDLLTVREVAERLSVCAATVYRLVGSGDLPHVRISNVIRIAPSGLVAFVARQRATNERELRSQVVISKRGRQ